jgi:hypothetical protein
MEQRFGSFTVPFQGHRRGLGLASSASRPHGKFQAAKTAARQLSRAPTYLVAGVLLSSLALGGDIVAAGGGAPPANAPQLTILFPSRDMVDLQNMGSTQVNVSVNYVGGTATARTIDATGAFTTTLTPDPNSAGGEVLINHPANPGMQPACWSSVLPGSVPPKAALAPGDTVTVTPVGGAATTHTVANINTAPAQLGATPGTVVVHGFALDAAGNQFSPAFNQIEVRLVSKKVPFDFNNTRTLRANLAGNKAGLITYDAATGGALTATFSGLDAHDLNLISTGQVQTRILWRDNVFTPSNITIYEADQVFPGPQGPCAAPGAGF